MERMSALDLKAFVPAKNLGISKQFYLDLGFALNWESDTAAQFELGSCRFILQEFFIEQHAHNFMMQLLVEDTDLWWKHIDAVGMTSKYPGVTAKPPALQPWGLRVLYLVDPTGVLWHIADQPNKARTADRKQIELRRVRRQLRVHDSDLSGSTFSNAKLERVRFDDANLTGASFSNVNLSMASFDDANLENLSIRNANIAGMTIDGILVTDLFDVYAAKHGPAT